MDQMLVWESGPGRGIACGFIHKEDSAGASLPWFQKAPRLEEVCPGSWGS